MSRRDLPLLGGTVSRRQMVAGVARWSVPTVLTMTLVTRQARAIASCPPCTKNTGGRCRACTMNQILNCQCEPCLGAPYCAGGARAAERAPGAMSAPQSGQIPGSTAPSASDLLDPYLRLLRRAPTSPLGENPFGTGQLPRSPFQASPFGGANPFSQSSPGSQGLYDRLRGAGRRPQ
jgi:hypothetical protein